MSHERQVQLTIARVARKRSIGTEAPADEAGCVLLEIEAADRALATPRLGDLGAPLQEAGVENVALIGPYDGDPLLSLDSGPTRDFGYKRGRAIPSPRK